MSAVVEGLPVITDSKSKSLHLWVIPGANRRITVMAGPAGLVLVHCATKWDREIERLDIPGVNDPVDEGGWNPRKITGGSGWSKHATGGAMDLNWSRHPYNVAASKTFTAKQLADLHKWFGGNGRYEDVLEWGGNWPSHPGSKAKTDGMHVQLSSRLIAPFDASQALATKLARTNIGKEILAANPSQKALITRSNR